MINNEGMNSLENPNLGLIINCSKLGFQKSLVGTTLEFYNFVIYLGPKGNIHNRNFYVLLTVHFSIFILVINQLDAQNFVHQFG